MKPEKQLYQWDVNQYLTGINPAAQYVDYTIGNEVIRLETDGTRCRIPDEVLQTYGGKTCYERYPDGTYRAYSFSVLYAPKPPDYVYTPEERTTFEALTARVDASIEEIKRRADSGEFTPKKGVDYFTDAEKTEMMESVSSGAVGEFRKVVDTATTEYNRNAAEKLTTYDTNDEQRTSDYNRNDEVKLEAYNQNHTEKVAEYNQNAETKTAEFDANAAALQEQMSEKANVDGYYEEMTVGDAEQLISTQFVEDNEPYLFRSTGGSSDVGNRAYLDKIVGGTVAWNQLLRAMRGSGSEKGLTFTRNADGSLNISGTIAEEFSYNYVPFTFTGLNFKRDGRKYLLMLNKPIPYAWGVSGYGATISANSIGGMWSNNQGTHLVNGLIFLAKVGTTIDIHNLRAMVIDLTQMFGTTIADYIYSLEQSQAGAGVAWFKKLFPKDYYEYNAGELLSVEGLQSHDMVGFNQWDEEWEVGSYDSDGLPIVSDDKIRTKNRISVKPSTAYYFKNGGSSNLTIFWYDDDDTIISYGGTSNDVKTSPANAKYLRFRTNNYGTTYNHDICINLSDPSRNGEYEPYEKHSYPLDSSITLRGIPKLDANNNLYYDGDEYTSDGKVKRKYGIVTFDGSNDEKWGKLGSSSASAYAMQIKIDGKIIQTSNRMTILCDKLMPVLPLDAWGNYSQFIAPVLGKDMIAAGISTITTVKDWRTYLASNPITVLFELDTPTTETAEPFHNIQIVDDFGTEEFVSTGIVPVGHKTRYPANLRDKLQHLPDLAGMDGTYLIRQTGKQMSLIHMPAVFPDIPTEDGTYTLKTVVTGGVATLQWVVE